MWTSSPGASPTAWSCCSTSPTGAPRPSCAASRRTSSPSTPTSIRPPSGKRTAIPSDPHQGGEMAVATQGTSSNYLQRGPSPSGLADVLDVILDKGLVVDLYVRVSLIGIELVTIDARVVD